MKFILLSILLISLSNCIQVKTLNEGPVYETPTIEKHSSPLDITFNQRLDLLNYDGKFKKEYAEAGKKKISLRANLAREFTFKALSDWLDHLGKQNLNMMGKGDFVDDVANLKGFAKLLQNQIIGKSNSIMDKLALLDLKLKQQKLIEEEVEAIKQHPGNISSNLGLNLPWKERLEELVNNAASVHSEFDVALNGICNVIRKVNLFVKTMERTKIDSTKIHQPGPEEIYYPNDHTVLPNQPTFHALGPKAGHFNNRNPLHNPEKSAKHASKTVTHHAKPTKSAHVKKSQKKIVKAITKQILPEIRKVITPKIQKAINKPSKADPKAAPTNSKIEQPKTVLDKIIQEEASLEKVPAQAVKPAVTKAVNRSINQVARKVAKVAAKKIAASKPLKHNQKVLAKTLKVVSNGTVLKPQDKNVLQVAKNIAKKDVRKKIAKVKKTEAKKLATKVINKSNIASLQGKASIKPLVENIASKAIKKINPKKLEKKVQKAIELMSTQNLKKNVQHKHIQPAKRKATALPGVQVKQVQTTAHPSPVLNKKLQPLEFAIDPFAKNNHKQAANHMPSVVLPLKANTPKATPKQPAHQEKISSKVSSKLVKNVVAHAKKANKAAKGAKAVAQKLINEARHKPGDEKIQRKKEHAIQIARDAIEKAKEAKKTAFEAKVIQKSIKDGQTNAKTAEAKLQNLKNQAVKLAKSVNEKKKKIEKKIHLA